MRVCFNKDKTAILFQHENAKEYKNLMAFPGFLKGYPYMYLPCKAHVAYNVFSRYKSHIPASFKLAVDQDVYDFIMTPTKLKALPLDFKYHTSPHEAQDIALRFLYTFESGALLLDPGLGKTKVVLDYIVLKRFKKVCIVCPKPLLFVWEEEVSTHRPEIDFYTVQTTDWETEKTGVESHSVIFINYNKAVILESQLKKIGFDFIHLDEALIKDPDSKRTIALTNIASTVPYRCLGSGTLINNSVMDVYSPSRFIEPAIVGNYFSKFFNHHTVRIKYGNSDRPQVVNFKYIHEAKSILETIGIVMTKAEWLKDLPGKEFEDIYVPPSQQQREMTYDLAKNYVVKIDDEFVTVDNPLVMLSKLYQISQGFIHKNYEKQDIDELLGTPLEGSKKKKARKTFKFENQPKIDALGNLIKTKIKKDRAIIWFNLTAEYELISDLLNSMGCTYLTIRGGEKTTGEKVKSFNTDSSIQFLVCQAKSVNYGITVLGNQKDEDINEDEDDAFAYLPQFSNAVFTEIFYSLSFSSETYSQQQDRIHRFGQKHTCKYYRIFCNTPVEHQIRKAIEEKLILRSEMLIDIMETLKKDEDFFKSMV